MRIKVLSIFALILSSLTASAVSPKHDEYYSDDIFTAIEEAKHRTHHYNYSRSKRYNRTTSQSIQLPRLLNKEMDKEVVEGAVGATAAGDNRTTDVSRPQSEVDLGRNISDKPSNPVAQQDAPVSTGRIERSTTTFIPEIKHQSSDFTGASRNITADVRISAEVRP